MNVQVKHNGTSITGFVIEYERVHKICTGIGQLDIEVVDTINRTFKPWDEIDIWENGDFKVRYYVSSVEHNIPRGSIQLSCQDNSKRIVDYFIPDSYTIDYPSYNKYWIDKFLTEAGVDIIWNTSSPGTLLSNYTALGLTTVYEQVISLLQMSGWYMYFDGDGKAVIGSMNIDFAEDFGSVGKTDILNILVASNDKMLRNKALVFGAYDGYTGTNAKAAVTVHTPWNYDHNDLRTVVISNSNIKDSGTAYSMANQIVKEFARITVEKHITLWGARNYNLGTALRVTSNVWKGRGLITTFGTSMSKQGLVTNVVLDERCPRLFGFFDFGDYVYVAFYGDGVWRKHIKYDPTWYNFSTGLTDLAITDMHINNGVFGAVGASGAPFYAIDALPWHPITLTGLMSSIEDNVDPAIIAASGEVPMKEFTGLSARAVTIDKLGNTVKFAIDTASGVNYGDYFLEHGTTLSSGIVTSSGISSSGVMRSWIVEYDVLAGDLYGTPYPVSLSGNFGYSVVDLDNDGLHDYISVATSGTVSFPKTALGYNFGRHTSQPSFDTDDSLNKIAYNLYDDFDQVGETLGGTATTGALAVAVFNDESSGERELVWIETVAGVIKFKRISVTKPAGTIISSTLASPNLTVGYQYINKTATNTYHGYRIASVTPSSGNAHKREAFMVTWNASANTVTSEVSLGSIQIPTATTSSQTIDNSAIMVNGVIYSMSIDFCRYASSGSDYRNYIGFYMLSVDTQTNTATGYKVNQIDFETGGPGLSDPKWTIFSLTGSIPFPKFTYQNGDFPSYAFYVREWNSTSAGLATVLRNWLVYSQYGGTFQRVKIQETNDDVDTSYLLATPAATTTGCQLTNDRFVLYAKGNTRNLAYVYNGLSVSIVSISTATPVPFTWNPQNITPVFGQHDDFYVAKTGTDYYQCDPAGLTATALIEFPTGYTPVKMFSTSDYLNTLYYWQLNNNDTFKNEIFRFSSTGYYGTKITPAATFAFDRPRGWIAGNFFIDFGNQPGVANSTTLKWLYVDNQDIGTVGRIYQVLQRDGTDFKLIQQELYPIRVDISGNSPVLTVGSGESTFQSNYVYETELVTVQAVPSGVTVASGGNQVNDYRYTYLQPTIGMMSSGGGITSTILYVSRSGIFAADAMSFSGGFTQMFSIPSGEALRIETSNYGIDGQYIFVSASGVMTASGQGQTFYQQDPASFIFYEHATNYPQTRATIIRLDDAM